MAGILDFYYYCLNMNLYTVLNMNVYTLSNNEKARVDKDEARIAELNSDMSGT